MWVVVIATPDCMVPPPLIMLYIPVCNITESPVKSSFRFSSFTCVAFVPFNTIFAVGFFSCSISIKMCSNVPVLRPVAALEVTSTLWHVGWMQCADWSAYLQHVTWSISRSGRSLCTEYWHTFYLPHVIKTGEKKDPDTCHISPPLIMLRKPFPNILLAWCILLWMQFRTSCHNWQMLLQSTPYYISHVTYRVSYSTLLRGRKQTSRAVLVYYMHNIVNYTSYWASVHAINVSMMFGIPSIQLSFIIWTKKHVNTFPNVWKHFQTCENIAKCVKTLKPCENTSKHALAYIDPWMFV